MTRRGPSGGAVEAVPRARLGRVAVALHIHGGCAAALRPLVTRAMVLSRGGVAVACGRSRGRIGALLFAARLPMPPARIMTRLLNLPPDEDEEDADAA